jgi:hypothetical protein
MLRFNAGLNIITGWSRTGKSSVLDIIEFCFGRTHPTYPAGVLTTSVAWFSMEVEYNGGTAVIGRPANRPGTAGVEQAMLLLDETIDSDAASTFVSNTNARTVRLELTRLMGVPENQARPGTLLRAPLQATIAQALLFCFQAQSEIANRNILFHRTDDEQLRIALRDTLPYFVGAFDMDTIALQRRLDERRRALRIAERRLVKARIQIEDPSGSRQLLAEAAVAGLTESPTDLSEAEALSELRRIAAEPAASPSDNDLEAVIGPRRRRQSQLHEELAALQHRLRVLEQARGVRDTYQDEAGALLDRLQAVELVPAGEHDSSACPRCGQPTSDDVGSVSQIRGLISDLGERLRAVQVSEPRSSQLRGELDGAIRERRAELHRLTQEVLAAEEQNEALRRASDARLSAEFLRGRIAEFVAAEPEPESEVRSLEEEVAVIEAQVSELEDLLDPAAFAERTSSLLRVVSQDVTGLAQRLELEHSENPINLEAGSLTLVADTSQGPIPLARMGSAANVVGYHVAAHLALHRWFVNRDRPVPSFLVLDQPSQAFYQDDVRSAEDEEISDEDRARVQQIYALLRGVVGELGDRLQVIVLDHANLDNAWFQASVIENWREGRALVPEAWIKP